MQRVRLPCRDIVAMQALNGQALPMSGDENEGRSGHSTSYRAFLGRLSWTGVGAAMVQGVGSLVDSNSLGLVVPELAHHGLLSGMVAYFVHQFAAGVGSNLTPHIISISWEVIPLMQQVTKVRRCRPC